ncbi:MAG: hypothetical protein NVS3B19_16460 [Ginsengibacter sp.]
MMFKYFFLIAVFFIITFHSSSQNILKGFVADSFSHKALPFASIHFVGNKTGIISNIDGSFSIYGDVNDSLTFSFTGYQPKVYSLRNLRKGDTIFLTRRKASLQEVVIVSNGNKIRRIINNTVNNKEIHNPDKYSKYECNVYYKMKVSASGFEGDTVINYNKNRKIPLDTTKDSIPDFFTDKSYLMISETYSKRMYERPQRLNEIVLASRFSGLSKTYFANIITDVLPFHIYSDFIKLNEQDYQNPIAKGWENKYQFILEDEIESNNDTTYVLSYSPKKNKYFNSLRGNVYINKNGYAISHMTGSTSDTTKRRQVNFEQIYNQQSGRWFPKELNYTFTISKIFSSNSVIKINGHSNVDSVIFDSPFSRKADHSRPIIIDDSVDKRTEKNWWVYRSDTLNKKELNTYHVIDSFSTKHHIENFVKVTAKLGLNKIPIGSFDLDLDRILKSNEFEGVRVGIGLYSNNKISKYFSGGGWFGYGTEDKKLKGGMGIKLFPRGDKNNWLAYEVEHDYQKRGEVYVYNEINKRAGTNWVLRNPDVVNKMKFSGSVSKGYLQINPEIVFKELKTFPGNEFLNLTQSISEFKLSEINIGFRYAYGEKRIPIGDEYIPFSTKFPIVYFRLGAGKISSSSYSSNFIRAVATITFKHHTNRWGVDDLRVDGGNIFSTNHQSLPASFLFVANGLKVNQPGLYFQGGFLTMPPSLYFSNQFISVFFKHDFDHFLWQTKYSKPFISVGHNLFAGGISEISLNTNNNLSRIQGAYHESGLLLNQLLKYNFRIIDLSTGGGIYHHWNSSGKLNHDNVFVLSLSTSF